MLTLNTGGYTYRITSYPDGVVSDIEKIYGAELINSVDAPVDFEIALKTDSFLRRFFRPQITFYADQQSPFKPMPLAQAYPVLEWGMNWCVAAFDYNHFIVHAAVVEKNGKAIIFPATPGSGKSTLSAYLSQAGWNLYSDEMAIIDVNSNRVNPVFRPVSLKNNSIELFKQWFPDIVCTDTAKGTQKGDVALFRCISWEQHRQLGQAEVVGIVFPKYKPDTELTIYQLDKLQGFQQISSNAFNYNITGQQGFETTGKLVNAAVHFEVHYSNVRDVSEFLTEEIIKG